MKEFEFVSKGAGMIHAYRWEPEGEPRAIVQLIHGVAEYALRYDAFARFLTSRGCVVLAHDHMGHGKSEGCGVQLYFKGGWAAAMEDCHSLYCQIRREFPRLPYVIFGHSMGSFLLRSLLYTYPQMDIAAAVICGTAWQPALILGAGRAVCALERMRLGAEKHSRLMNSLMFGAYNKKIKSPKTPNDWISSTEQSVMDYTNDPLCGGPVSVGLAGDMLYGLAQNQKMKNLKKMPKALPILFIAGEDDPVGDMGKGIHTSAKQFRKAGMENVTVHLTKGRHEILLEAHCKEIYDILWNFLKKCLNL